VVLAQDVDNEAVPMANIDQQGRYLFMLVASVFRIAALLDDA